jgi:hypothetical protein
VINDVGTFLKNFSKKHRIENVDGPYRIDRRVKMRYQNTAGQRTHKEKRDSSQRFFGPFIAFVFNALCSFIK